jgi:hypothetical protein
MTSSFETEHDPFFPDHVREEGQKLLAENKVEHELRIFKDVPHGTFRNSYYYLSHAPLTNVQGLQCMAAIPMRT